MAHDRSSERPAHIFEAQADALLAEGNLERADSVLCEASSKYPDHPWIRVRHAEVAERAGNLSLAATRWKQLQLEMPDLADGWFGEARVLIKSGGTDAAFRMIAAAVARFPDSNNGLSGVIAAIQVAAGNLDAGSEKGMSLLDGLSRTLSGSIEVAIAYAEFASAQERWSEAAAAWAEVRRLAPNEIRGFAKGGQAALSQRNFMEAEALLAEALRKGSDDPLTWLEYAESAARRGAEPDGYNRFEAAFRRFPDEASTAERFANAKLNRGDLAGAEAILAPIANRFPDDVWVRLQHAITAMRGARWDIAEARWRAFRSDFPAMQDGWFDGAEVLARMGRHHEAEELLRDGLQLKGVSVWNLIKAIHIALRNTNTSGAAEYWLDGSAALKFGPGEQRAFYNVGTEVFGRLLDQGDATRLIDAMWIKLLQQEEETGIDYAPGILRQMLPLYFHGRSTYDAFQRFARDRLDLDIPPAAQLNADRVRFALGLEPDPVTLERMAEHFALTSPLRVLSCLFDGWLMPENVALLHRILPRLVLRDDLTPKVRYNLAVFAATGSSDVLCALWDRAATGVPQGFAESDGPEAVLAAAGTRRRLALATAPAILQRCRRLRVALCVSGQLRGYEAARSTWSCLGLDGHDVDTFVHTWANIGRKLPVPPHCARAFDGAFLQIFQDAFRDRGRESMEDMYPNLFDWFRRSSVVTVADLSKFYETPYVVVEDDELDPFRDMPNHVKMYYKAEGAWEIAQATGNEYDLAIRIRPDKSFFPGHVIDLREIHVACLKERKILADGGAFLHYDVRLGMGDQFAIGTAEAMNFYSRAYSITKEAKQKPSYGYPVDVLSHETFAAAAFYNGIIVEQLPQLAFGSPLDLGRIEDAELRRLLEVDIASRTPSTLDQALLMAVGNT
jgi:predicted Zn-dependent protease